MGTLAQWDSRLTRFAAVPGIGAPEAASSTIASRAGC
jgi:hypothetical protein